MRLERVHRPSSNVLLIGCGGKEDELKPFAGSFWDYLLTPRAKKEKNRTRLELVGPISVNGEEKIEAWSRGGSGAASKLERLAYRGGQKCKIQGFPEWSKEKASLGSL